MTNPNDLYEYIWMGVPTANRGLTSRENGEIILKFLVKNVTKKGVAWDV
jgi:hypothetical protein